MPVYAQHYRRWMGQTTPRWLRWTVITRYHLRQLFTGKGRLALIALLVLSGAVHLTFLAIIYILANAELLSFLGQVKLPEVNAEFFIYPFVPQGFIVGLLTLIVGSGLIADDRRDNAVPLYLSKPLTPTEYLVGKCGVLAVFTLAVTAVPVNLLFLFEVLVHGGRAFFKAHWWLPLSITSFSVVITALCGAVILMASSLVKKGSLAGVFAIGLFIGHNVLTGILVSSFRNEKLMRLSLQFDLHRLGLWLFGLDDSPTAGAYPFSGQSAGLVILTVIVVCLAIARWRIRPVEVVK